MFIVHSGIKAKQVIDFIKVKAEVMFEVIEVN
jgi:hypothetical protein